LDEIKKENMKKILIGAGIGFGVGVVITVVAGVLIWKK
jgi:glucokinase